ncbi:MAG: FAD-binding protein, partial [Streptosporangiaceae bacterium]
MQVSEQVALAEKTTLGLGGPARYWASAEAEGDLPEAAAWARTHGAAWTPLGGGSNLLVSDRGYDGLALHIGLKGMRDAGQGRVEAAAGEEWDGFVAWCVERGL